MFMFHAVDVSVCFYADDGDGYSDVNLFVGIDGIFIPVIQAIN